MPTVTGFTIDSESSQDLDDAIWVELEGDRTRLQVHIADVDHTVPKGVFLDQQAFKRGATQYLPNLIKSMFPQSVEAEMSLLPFVERPVVTVDMLLDRAGELLDVQIFEAVLVSQEKFSYAAVEGILRGAPHHLQPQLKQLENVTQSLMNQRCGKGAVYGRMIGDFYVNEEGRLFKRSARSQQMIAELMILTNRLVSEFMHDRQLLWLYRTHDYRGLDELPAERQQFIQALMAIADETRLQKELSGHFERAKYNAHPSRHAGLGLEVYTHFTSPIRRYADLVNHRLLKAAINHQPCPYTIEELEAIATSLTERQQTIQAKKVERYREQAQKEAAKQLETNNLERLSTSEFSRVLKTAVGLQQVMRIEPEIQRRLEAETLQPMDFYQLLIEAETTAENIQFKLQVWQAIADKPVTLQIINLLRDNWKPGAKVEFREESSLGGWAALCIVTHEETPHCPPAWSVSRTKAAARLLSGHQWLESWLWEELTTPDSVPFPDAPPQPASSTPANEAIATKPAQEFSTAVDFVSALNQYAQQHGDPLPEYQFDEPRTGYFVCQCTFIDLEGQGEGTSKKKAKVSAAEKVWLQIQLGAANPHNVKVAFMN